MFAIFLDFEIKINSRAIVKFESEADNIRNNKVKGEELYKNVMMIYVIVYCVCNKEWIKIGFFSTLSGIKIKSICNYSEKPIYSRSRQNSEPSLPLQIPGIILWEWVLCNLFF